MVAIKVIELRKNKLKNISLIIVIIFSILFLFSVLLRNNELINFFLILIFISTFFFVFFSLFIEPYEIHGKIYFYEDKIIINYKDKKNILYLEEIQTVNINYSGYAGESSFLSRGFNNGCENFITIFTYKNEYHYRILFEKQQQYNVLHKLTKKWYEKN
jgi:hypothetical protein